MSAVWDGDALVETLASLPAAGPLAARTVIVLHARMAHALRCALVRAGREALLAGTRFVGAGAAAAEVLLEAGVALEDGEEEARPRRLAALFRAVPPRLTLRYFEAALLRAAPGWEDAFARTITDLEGAGLRPEALPGGERWEDLGVVWRALDVEAGGAWTPARVFAEAAARLESTGAAAWPFDVPVLAVVTGDEPATRGRFLRAVPEVHFALLAARPPRARWLERVRRLYGDDLERGARIEPAPRRAASERDLLASYLFEAPEVLADSARARSAGADGTVLLETHAGVEEELEATADWVAREVLEEGTPLDEVAVLVPALDPLGGLVAARLARLSWHDGTLPVFVAGGLPATGLAAGARALAVVRALRAHLAAEPLADVLPALRMRAPEQTDAGRESTAEHAGAGEGNGGGDAGPARRHLSRGAAVDLVYALGTVGGNPARPDGALEWRARAAARDRELAALVAQARGAERPEEGEQTGAARELADLERLLADLRAVRPALEALGEVSAVALRGASLAEVWAALRGFLGEWVLLPGAGATLPSLLDAALAATVRAAPLAGFEALRTIEEVLAGLRVAAGRHGEPAVYVGALRGAVGLRFRALRVIGLSEGRLPAAPREDPVLPEHLHAQLPEAVAALLPGAADRSLAELHALDRVVRNATARVALSAPHVDLDRSAREPSSLFVEAAAALGRGGLAIPDARALERDALAPSRAAARTFRLRAPLSEAAWQDRVATAGAAPPAAWRRAGVELDLARMAALAPAVALADSFGPMDGALGAAGLRLPGLGAERAISPTRLRTLLGCPHRFLFEVVLGWGQPAAAPSLGEIEPLAYGRLFHRVAERFGRAHGAAFGARRQTLEHWLAAGDALCAAAFTELLDAYPLPGEPVRRQQLDRLRRDFRAFLEYDWDGARPRDYAAVERGFGYDAPLALPAGPGRVLYVRGYIDRLDREGEATLVRDLKTGRVHPRVGRAAAPDPVLDVQLGLYGLV
ncbi:MAG TPA: PD-(D/E)XK nuclease family protein, partial [Myxococcota bacterium]|nr:PD-(D/E)XK nuclease family protein [Myxococcota bacterium]